MIQAGPKPYHRFAAWQNAHALALKIYETSRSFPKDEQYGITSQLRRSALSIPTNIVEGTDRQGQKELRNFLNIALGSLAEVEYLLEFARDIGYITNIQYTELDELRRKTGSPLWNFYKSL